MGTILNSQPHATTREPTTSHLEPLPQPRGRAEVLPEAGRSGAPATPGAPLGPWRLAIVLPYDPASLGGVASTAIGMADHLRRRGHTVHLVVGGQDAPAPDPETRQVPARIVPLPLNGSISRIALPVGAAAHRAIEQLLARGRYDALVVHEPALPLGQALLRRSTSANVGVVHAYSERRLPPWLDGLVRQGHLDHLDLVDTVRQRRLPLWLLEDLLDPGPGRLHAMVAVSEAAAIFARAYLDMPYTIVPNGLDVEAFAPARAARRAPVRTVLFLGRPEPRKGLSTLLEAVARLATAMPDLRLEVAGDGDEGAWGPYRTEAAQLGVGDRVAFLGRLSEPAKRMALGRAWALAVPSLGGESQGKVLLEGLAAGVPVVASYIQGYAGVLRDGVDGLLVPPGDTAAWAQALRRVLADRVLAGRLAAQGLATVRAGYDWGVVVPRLEAVLAAAIAAQPQGADVASEATAVA